MVLIITDPLDLEAALVAAVLERDGHRVHRLSAGDFPTLGDLTATWTSSEVSDLRVDEGSGVTGDWSVALSSRIGDDAAIGFDRLDGVWWRRIVAPHAQYPALDATEQRWVEAETAAALGVVWALAAEQPGLTLLADPASVGAVAPAPVQFARAARRGFRVPDTLITSDADALAAFLKRHPDGVLYKSNGHRVLGSFGRQWTSDDPTPRFEVIQPGVVSADDLRAFTADPRPPSLFQAFVAKREELRVTVVGEQTFAVTTRARDLSTNWSHHRFESDAAFDERFDWFPVTLPASLQRRCVAVVADLGLTFGAIDLAVDPDGTPWFLELNADGDWFDIQETYPELDVAGALAHYLTTPLPKSERP